MKKKYSLDYSIETPEARMQAIRDILDSLESNPSPSELEQMASYVLYAKDENGQNAVQRGELIEENKRYNSFVKKGDKNDSLDELMENPAFNENEMKPYDTKRLYLAKKTTIKRPIYNKDGTLKSIGDADIPGMQGLWDCIDHLEHTLAANKGDLPFNDDDTVIDDPYRLYQLNHMIIDIRRHQYYLKDYYKETIHFLNLKQPARQHYNFDEDAAYWIPVDQLDAKIDSFYYEGLYSRDPLDYWQRFNPDTNQWELKWVVKRQKFDWENPDHIRALIPLYSDLYMELYDEPYSWGRTLLFDFDRYIDMADLSDLRRYVLLRAIDKAKTTDILREIKEKFGISYSEPRITNILYKEIPNKIAQLARRERLLDETPTWKARRCFTCKCMYPRDSLFFNRNSRKKDHFSPNCKMCEKAKRIRRGQSAYDKRSKDEKMRQMQTGKT